jgi:esterase/lipase
VSKFVGKFRKNQEYKDDFEYKTYSHTRKNNHAEIKKLIAQAEQDNREIYEDIEIMISQDDKE